MWRPDSHSQPQIRATATSSGLTLRRSRTITTQPSKSRCSPRSSALIGAEGPGTPKMPVPRPITATTSTMNAVAKPAKASWSTRQKTPTPRKRPRVENRPLSVQMQTRRPSQVAQETTTPRRAEPTTKCRQAAVESLEAYFRRPELPWPTLFWTTNESNPFERAHSD